MSKEYCRNCGRTVVRSRLRGMRSCTCGISGSSTRSMTAANRNEPVATMLDNTSIRARLGLRTEASA